MSKYVHFCVLLDFKNQRLITVTCTAHVNKIQCQIIKCIRRKIGNYHTSEKNGAIVLSDMALTPTNSKRTCSENYN